MPSKPEVNSIWSTRVLNSTIADVIDPKFESLEITGLQCFLDGALGNQNGIAEKSDIDIALTSGYFKQANSESITWQNLLDGITESGFTSEFLEQQNIGYLSSFVEQAVANKSIQPEQFNALFLLIPDAIRAQAEDIKLTPTWLKSNDNPAAYTLHFSRIKPANKPTNSVSLILSGASSNANLYTDRALQLMQQTPAYDEVIVVGNPQDSLAAPQPSLGWGFGLERSDKEIVHARMAAVVDAQVLALEKNLNPNQTLSLNINDHSAGFWQTQVWYNRFKSAHPQIKIEGFESFSGTFGLSHVGGVMNNHTLTGLLRLFYPIAKTQSIDFATAKTEMISNMFAGGDQNAADRFRVKGMGYGKTSWSAAAAVPADFADETEQFMQTVLAKSIPFRYNVSVNDHCVSAAAALESILKAVVASPSQSTASVQFHIYGIKDWNDSGTDMSKKEIRLLLRVLKKHDVQINSQGVITDSRFKDLIVFHQGEAPGHFLINQTATGVAKKLAENETLRF